MLKSLLSAASIFVLLFSTFVFPRKAAACPVKEPETLLSLYRNSDAIYVARFDKTDDHEITENTDEYTVVNIKKHFDISSTLKGESRKLFVLDDQEYRYKNREETANEESEEAEEDPYEAATLKSGDLLLLFLKNGEDGENGEDEKSLELTDYRDGIKKLSREHLDVYEARIRELNSIFSGKKASDAAIVEWLIRCAEDPATRWEGAYELQQSFQEAEWKEASERERKEKLDSGEAVDEEEVVEEADDEGVSEGEIEVDNTIYAKLLNENQKQSLMSYVLDRAPETTRSTESNDKKSKVFSRGDQVLIELVSHWGDSRFATFLLDRLRNNSDEPYAISDLMNTIAKVLDDKEISDLAEQYGDAYYQEDDAVVEKEETEEAAEEASEENATTPANADSAGRTSGTAEPEAGKPASENDAAENAPPKKTYKQLRGELYAKFIDRSSIVIAVAESENAERASQ